jgi:hypothetical protein
MHRLVVALTTLLSLAAAAYLAGYLFLFSGSADRAADLAPADTAIYVSFSLQPSSAQDANIAQLAARLPGFADTSALDQKIDELAQNLLAQLAGLDYRQHVKPWLGSQVTVVMRDAVAGTTLLVAVRDQAAAVEALSDVEAGRGGPFEASSHAGIEVRVGEGIAYAFVAETLVVGPDAAAVEAVIDVSQGADSLADRAEFGTAMARLPGDRLAALYLDLAAAVGEDSRYRSAAGALVAAPEGLVLRGRADTADDDAAASPAGAADEATTLAGWMPADTQVAVASFDAAELLFAAEALLADVPAAEGLTGTIASARILFSFGLGLDLNELIGELMRGEGGLALQGLDTDTPSGQLLLRPADPDAAAALLDDVSERLADSGASVEREQREGGELVTVDLAGLGSLAYAVLDEVIIIGLGAEGVEAAISAHETGDSLLQTDEYSAAYALAGTRGGNEVIVDPAVLLALAGIGGELPADVRDILERLGAVAITLPDRGDHLEFHVVLTVE